MRYRELEEKLRKLGCEEVQRRGGGSHRRWRNPVTGKSTPVPDWGSKDIRPGTLRGIIRQLGLDWDEFKNS
jgi:mRNA interferase HicA